MGDFLDWIFMTTGRMVTAGFIAIALISVLIWAPNCAGRNTIEHKTVTVCKKEAVTVSNSNEYRIYTSDGVYIVDDYWPWIGAPAGSRFNTADFYSSIKEGKTYDMTAYGWRIPFLTAFQNITHLENATRVPIGTC